MQSVLGRAAPHEPVKLARVLAAAFPVAPKAEDADDDMVLEAAVNGRTEVIATFNARDFAGVAQEFGIALLTPNAILRRM